MLHDVRQAIRRLSSDRSFAALAVVTLALGIGANSAIFSLIESVLLRPLPYRQPDRVVMIWKDAAKGETTWISNQELAGYRAEASTLEQLSAYSQTEGNLTGGAEPERVRVAAVTSELFAMLGAAPLHGRTFTAAEGQPGAGDVVVLGHGLWRRRFGGAQVVGQAIRLNGVAHTIVGIMPPAFRLPLDYRQDRLAEGYIPLVIDPANLGQWGDRGLIAVGRLRPGADPAAATREFASIGRGWIRAGYVADQGDGRLERTAVPVREFVTGDIRLPLLILLGTVGFVLLIAVANVANLLLARAGARSRDIAIRAALGAARVRLVRQMLAETVLLGLAGSIAAAGVSWAVVRVLTSLRPTAIPRADELRLDASVLIVTALLGILAGIVFGLAPALQLSRQSLTSVLHEGGRSGTAGRRRQSMRKTLVVIQLALSVVLVLGAGLLTRSLMALHRVDLGFDPSSVLTAQVVLPAREYPEADDVVRFYRLLTEDLGRIPGVQHAGAARILPLTRTIGDWSITLESRPFSPAENPNGDFQAVTPGYFEAMNLRLLRGRVFTRADSEDAPMVAVVNETMAGRYWPGEDAIGKRFHLGTADQPWVSIVGIVATVRHNAVVEEPRAEMYLPHAQLPREIGYAPRGMALAVRTGAEPLALVDALRRAVRGIDPNLPVSDIQTMESVAARALAEQRFTASLLAAFAVLALALAAIGVYGTVSLLVSERAREIGIRMALGARRRTIVTMMLSQGLGLAAGGLAAGLAASIALTRLLDSLVYGVSTLDPFTFTAVPALLAAVALLATLAPALRAARVDPIATLRG